MSQTVQTITSGNMKDLGSALMQSIPTDLPDEDAVYWIGKKKELHRKIQQVLRRSTGATDVGAVSATTLLELVTTVQTAAVEAFSAKEKLAIGTQDGVKIVWHGDNFKTHFLGKCELDVPARDLRVHKLRKKSLDAPIIAELGGQELVETHLATMFEMLKKQVQGQKGDLLVNGYANIFYIKDDVGVLWAVGADWGGGGWSLDADSVTYPYAWSADGQVVSR
jgi:hypothetical protein